MERFVPRLSLAQFGFTLPRSINLLSPHLVEEVEDPDNDEGKDTNPDEELYGLNDDAEQDQRNGDKDECLPHGFLLVRKLLRPEIELGSHRATVNETTWS